ncbi:DUF4407 domain-containing protein [Neolewinella lacunae]|uniref:DUF4407 domain-containing protein n=1 Tax=Neolewinella lacunae TaxID=1517758 RepID=A0A923TDX7_9BACT|nr:DUF4407 domain-containing protein [Neolewinella lacunae]MBC6995307.1 DUF4407 domain-containing protein [Neolewinella lacunae]MDN3633019.1 DUF4407 domain-containing protein [Neolewinella lacunae]
MNNAKDFFLFCSGVDRTILDQVPSDENKYLGIGGTIFFTGVLAFISAGYALYTVFDSYVMAVLFGVVWGLMIFNLDRYIVSSMKSKGGFFGNFMVALPRIAMAVLLALVISKPLELKIFEKEINAELIVMEQETFKAQEDRIQARFNDRIAAQEAEIAQLRGELAAKTLARDEAAAAALAEADGSGGSGIRNMGPIYRAKQATAAQAQAELVATQAELQPRIDALLAEAAALRSEVSSEITGLQRSAYGGMAARIDALDRLGSRSNAIYLASIFIMLLFIAIETAPIFTKLISPRSPYDHLLNEHEHVYEMAAKESITVRANEVKNRLRTHTEVGIHQTTADIAAKKAEIDHTLRQHRESLGARGYGLG